MERIKPVWALMTAKKQVYQFSPVSNSEMMKTCGFASEVSPCPEDINSGYNLTKLPLPLPPSPIPPSALQGGRSPDRGLGR